MSTPGSELDESAFELLERGYEAVLGGADRGVEIERLPPRLRERLAGMLAVRDGLLGGPARSGSQRVGAFRLVRLLGRGGQGEVWLAEDERIPRQVALKLLATPVTISAERLLRFRREAELAARLEHPSICTVYESGSAGGWVYLAMRYVAGQTLAQWIEARRGGTATRLDVVACAEQCARALHEAHRAGVLHRDVKPGNVMIEADGRPVLLDFGLAEDLREGAPELTREGQVLGTPAYLPPERLTSAFGIPDPRSDVWSLAATFYEALTLQRPFDAPTRDGLYQAILNHEPRPVTRWLPGAPRDLARVFEVALTKAMDRRYATALDFAEDLRAVRLSEPIRARPTPQVVKAWKWVRRHRVLAAAASLATLAVLVSLLVTWLSLRETADALRVARERLRLTEAQLLAETDPGAALRSWLAIADEVPRGMVNDAILRLLERTREQAPLLGHAGGVHDVAFAADGQTIATVCADGKVRLFSAKSATLLVELPWNGKPTALAFTADGGRLLVGDERGGVTPFEVATKPLREPAQHRLRRQVVGSTAVSAIARAESGGELAVACAGGRVAVLDAAAERVLLTSADLFEPIVRVLFNHAGDRLFALCATGRVHVLARADLGSVAMLNHAGSVVNDAILARDDQHLLTACADSLVWIWDLATGEVVRKLAGHEASVAAIALHPNGSGFATGSADRTVVLWSYPACEEITRLKVHARPLTRLAYAPDGGRLVSAAEDGGVRLWRTERAPRLATLVHDADEVSEASFSPDGKFVLTLARGLPPRVFDAERGELVQVLPELRARATAAGFSPDGNSIVVAYADARLRTFTWPGGSELLTMRLPDVAAEAGELALTFSNDGARVLVTSSSGAAAVFAVATGLLLGTPRGLAGFHPGSDAARSAFRPDGTALATVLPDARGTRLCVWSADGGESLAIGEGHTEAIEALAWSPDGTRLATASADATVRIVAVQGRTLRPVVVLRGHNGCVQDVRFSRDGQQVLTAGMDCTARLWDARSGVLLRTFAGHDGMLYGATFSPDDRRILTSSWDHTAAIWEVATGERLVRFASHDKAVLGASWRRDGDFVVSHGKDGTARIWPGDPVRFARER